MATWWWFIPAVVGVIGLVFLLSGLSGLFRRRIISGGLSAIGGGGLLAAAAIASLTGLNIQTYARLTYERPVAVLDLKQLGPQYFEVSVTQPEGEDGSASRSTVYPVHGDEWRVEAQVLKWKPWANVLGLDSQYRLDRLSGRYQSIEQERSAERSVHALSGETQAEGFADRLPWRVSAWDMARRYRGRIDAVDTLYGSAAYMPMADGARYEVWITQSGLVARPVNDAARNASAGGWQSVD